jgi:hypothetical protein
MSERRPATAGLLYEQELVRPERLRSGGGELRIPLGGGI